MRTEARERSFISLLYVFDTRTLLNLELSGLLAGCPVSSRDSRSRKLGLQMCISVSSSYVGPHASVATLTWQTDWAKSPAQKELTLALYFVQALQCDKARLTLRTSNFKRKHTHCYFLTSTVYCFNLYSRVRGSTMQSVKQDQAELKYMRPGISQKQEGLAISVTWYVKTPAFPLGPLQYSQTCGNVSSTIRQSVERITN